MGLVVPVMLLAALVTWRTITVSMGGPISADGVAAFCVFEPEAHNDFVLGFVGSPWTLLPAALALAALAIAGFAIYRKKNKK